MMIVRRCAPVLFALALLIPAFVQAQTIDINLPMLSGRRGTVQPIPISATVPSEYDGRPVTIEFTCGISVEFQPLVQSGELTRLAAVSLVATRSAAAQQVVLQAGNTSAGSGLFAVASALLLANDTLCEISVSRVTVGDREVPYTANAGRISITGGAPVIRGEALGLGDPRPNPMAYSCEIEYSVPVAGSATFSLRNVRGSEVWSKTVAHTDKGLYLLRFPDTSEQLSMIPNGTYYLTLTVDGQTATKQVVILR